MRAFSALSAPKRYPLRLLPTDSSATVAILPSALRSQPSPRVPIGVLNAEGCCHLSCGLLESHDSLATRRDPAVTPTRRLHMSVSRSNLFKPRCPPLRCHPGGLLRLAVIQRIVNFSGGRPSHGSHDREGVIRKVGIRLTPVNWRTSR